MPNLLAKGAEAYLFLEEWYGYKVIRKHRIPKKYRVPQLDHDLRYNRTIREARLLSAARQAGIRTPIIFNVNPDAATIIMEYIEGNRLKELLQTLPSKKSQKIFEYIGEAVAKLHKNDLCHGDLTTSNMIVHNENQIYFVDFGLGSNTKSIEEYGTDLHLLRRALMSTHYSQWKECFEAFKNGYQRIYGKGVRAVFQKIREIESRGRYIKERIR
jgi:TP53 regulating kinase-like protein